MSPCLSQLLILKRLVDVLGLTGPHLTSTSFLTSSTAQGKFLHKTTEERERAQDARECCSLHCTHVPISFVVIGSEQQLGHGARELPYFDKYYYIIK